MRHAALFSLILLLFLPGFSQEVQEGYKKINQFIVPVDLLDPAYPVMKSTGDEVRDAASFEEALRAYTKKLGRLPQYVYTGDVVKDQENYEKSIFMFLTEHPYFPQPLLSYDAQRDADVFEALWKGYFKYYPEQAKRIVMKEEGGVK